MDSLDRQLLNLVQAKFPICAQPYQALGDQLGISAEEVIQRLAALKDDGIVRRIGAIFDSKHLGYHSTLCAMKVPTDRIAEVAEIVNAYPGVTHNYLREHSYNMWFTLIAQGPEDVDKILAEIRQKCGIADLIDLPAVKFFKIRVDFDLTGGVDDAE